jgi:hypothetical protein
MTDTDVAMVFVVDDDPQVRVNPRIAEVGSIAFGML